MSIGDAWKAGMGSLAKEEAFKLLDAFVEAGGNFIDTSSNYQNEESEAWIGEWMKARGIRDELIIATKYTTNYKSYKLGKNMKVANYSGNSKKTMHVSVKASLEKLQTEYIDLLYVHWWDWTTSIEEIMDGLHNLVQSGKVLYLGISDTPAWIVSAANTYATSHGKTPFSVYQGKWSILNRDFERDIIPMARHFGMALAPWGVIGGGKLKTKKEVEARKAEGGKLRSLVGDNEQSEAEEKMSAALEKVANELGAQSIQSVALAYVMQKAQYVFPIIGGRRVEQLHQNIEALTLHLSDEQVKSLESVVPFDIGFPGNFIGPDPRVEEPGFMLTAQIPNLVFQKDGKPIGHQ
jgi:aryl-alcohol dehydrogenase-like predicted oxidoreductase